MGFDVVLYGQNVWSPICSWTPTAKSMNWPARTLNEAQEYI